MAPVVDPYIDHVRFIYLTFAVIFSQYLFINLFRYSRIREAGMKVHLVLCFFAASLCWTSLFSTTSQNEFFLRHVISINTLNIGFGFLAYFILVKNHLKIESKVYTFFTRVWVISIYSQISRLLI